MDAKPFSRSEYISRQGGAPLVRIIEDDQGLPFHPSPEEEREKRLCLPPEQLLLLRE
jgi:hypothetical protein